MSDLPVGNLASVDAAVRYQAATAIADAVDAGTALEAAAAPMVAALGDADGRVVQMAIYVLQTDAEKYPQGSTLPALRNALASDVEPVRRNGAFLLAGFFARQEDGAAVAALIANPDTAVRLGTLKALADGALPRAQQEAVVGALATALSDDNVNVRKEAIWSLYLMGSMEDASLEAAVPALEKALEEPATQGNAAIAWSFALCMRGESARVDALYPSATGQVQMGLMWGAADVAVRNGDLATLKKMFSAEDNTVRRGLGAGLWHLRGNKRDISLAGQAYQELMDGSPDDALLHARLIGVQQIVERGPNA